MHSARNRTLHDIVGRILAAKLEQTSQEDWGHWHTGTDTIMTLVTSPALRNPNACQCLPWALDFFPIILLIITDPRVASLTKDFSSPIYILMRCADAKLQSHRPSSTRDRNVTGVVRARL